MTSEGVRLGAERVKNEPISLDDETPRPMRQLDGRPNRPVQGGTKLEAPLPMEDDGVGDDRRVQLDVSVRAEAAPHVLGVGVGFRGRRVHDAPEGLPALVRDDLEPVRALEYQGMVGRPDESTSRLGWGLG